MIANSGERSSSNTATSYPQADNSDAIIPAKGEILLSSSRLHFVMMLLLTQLSSKQYDTGPSLVVNTNSGKCPLVGSPFPFGNEGIGFVFSPSAGVCKS